MRVRVSVANLGPTMTVPCGEVDSRHCIAILNSGSYKNGKRLFQPIGGAAELTQEGRQYLIENFDADNFHKNDARFEIDESHLNDVMMFFWNRNGKYFDIDPLREIREELSAVEFPDAGIPGFGPIPPVLTPEEAAQIQVVHTVTLNQPFSNEKGESPLAKDDVPSRRLFHYFDIEVPSREMFKKILTSPAVRELAPDEVATTNGGRSKGRTRDGDIIADNFIQWGSDLF